MTKQEIENYIVYAQDKLATKWATYTTDLSNGKSRKYPNIELIFSMVFLEAIFEYEPDENSPNFETNCLSEDQFCKVIAYIQKVIR